jgi:hypothetical protein
MPCYLPFATQLRARFQGWTDAECRVIHDVGEARRNALTVLDGQQRAGRIVLSAFRQQGQDAA